MYNVGLPAISITLDKHLTFNEACQELYEAFGRALWGILARFKQLKHISFKYYTKLFESGVEPVCTYDTDIWGFNKYLLGQIL